MSMQMITDRTEYLTGMSIESLEKQVAKATGVSITAQGLSEIAEGIASGDHMSEYQLAKLLMLGDNCTYLRYGLQ